MSPTGHRSQDMLRQFLSHQQHSLEKGNKETGLSPGLHPQEHVDKQTQRRIRVQEDSALHPVKRQRLIQNKEMTITKAATWKALEGQPCGSGVGFEADPDVEELSAAVPRGRFQPVAHVVQKPTFVMFDLETTNFIRRECMPHITQIAAMEPRSRSSFNCYVVPKLPIAPSAAEVTGIVVSDSGSMTVKGKPVDAHNVTSAMNKFLTWLEGFRRVVLIAHYGQRFDFPVLVSTATSIDVASRLVGCVDGFIDSLPMFKQVFPDRNSYKQEELVKTILKSRYQAHNAIADVEALGHLVQHANMSCDDMLEHSFKPIEVVNRLHLNAEKPKNL